jgi:hypothetical protein
VHHSIVSTADPVICTGPAIVDLAVRQLIDGGIGVAPALYASLAEQGLAGDDERLMPLSTEMLAATLDALRADDCSAAAYRLFETLDASTAGAAFNLLLLANFPEEAVDLAVLDDATLLCFVGLLCAAGKHDDAIALLAEIRGFRDLNAGHYAGFFVACRAAGHPVGFAHWWRPAAAMPATLDAARVRVAHASLEVAGYRALARRLAEAGDMEAALDTLATALALPIAEAEKLPAAEELAAIVAILLLQGKHRLTQATRLRWSLAGAPAVTARAADIAADPGFNPVAALADPLIALRARRYFRKLMPDPETGHAAVSPYAPRRGKPRVDTVWLEITNFCNQKCGFCPDMHREDARTWLPVAEVKRLVDEMAETVSVGSMQLNAYGEPLLHPNIDEILAHIRERQLPFPVYFTSHGMTLVEKKLKQLSHNYPSGIAISLHNDSQQSYAATRSAKIGDYDTLVTRVSALFHQMVADRAACHLRLYQMVCNGAEDWQVDPVVRGAFPNSAERMTVHVRKWEAIARRIAEAMPAEVEARPVVNPPEAIAAAFRNATHGDGNRLTILEWRAADGSLQRAFMSPRPVGTYANLLLEYDPRWKVERQVVNPYSCPFTRTPSLAIFATGRLGICCLDMNSTATFGALSDYPTLVDALASPEALRMFGEVSNGVATSRGCQICLGTGKQVCGTA